MATDDPPRRPRYDAAGRRLCSGCLKYLPLVRADGAPAFYRMRSGARGLDAYCRACRSYLGQQNYRRRKQRHQALWRWRQEQRRWQAAQERWRQAQERWEAAQQRWAAEQPEVQSNG